MLDTRMKRLARLLGQAEEAIRALPQERLLDGFDTNAAFADFLGECRANLESGQLPRPMQQRLQLAFLPTSDWDDCLVDVDLGNEIDDLIRALFGVTGS